MNRFEHRARPLSGPAIDIVPVVPSNSADLAPHASALYVETGGMLSVVTLKGNTRTFRVADFQIVPLEVQRVRSTGTTATGIHAMVIA